MTSTQPPSWTLCGSTVDVAPRWIDTHSARSSGRKWTSVPLCAGRAARQDEPPSELGDPAAAADAALEQAQQQIEAGEQSLRESPAARSGL